MSKRMFVVLYGKHRKKRHRHERFDFSWAEPKWFRKMLNKKVKRRDQQYMRNGEYERMSLRFPRNGRFHWW